MLSETIITASQNITFAELEGEALVLHVGTGHYFGLNELGLTILSLSKEPITYGDLVESLLERYDVERAQIERDLDGFLRDLEERSLVSLSNS